jgi:hypothetical protein
VRRTVNACVDSHPALPHEARMPELYLHNSLTRRRERFVPIDPGHVRM